MYSGKDFKPADPIESEVYEFDFSRDLATGEIITSSEWFCEVAADSEGADASPQSHLVLLPQNTDTVTMQRVAGLLDGVKYVLQAVVTTSDGNTIALHSHVLCEAPS